MKQSESLYPEENVVHELVDLVAQTFLHSHAVPVPTPPSEDSLEGDEWWTGWITLDGLTNSGVMLRCKEEFVRKAAQVWLEDSGPVSDALARDLLGELTNVVGGNIRSLIPMPSDKSSRLSMPTVWAGKAHVPDGGQVVHQQWWDCDGDLLLVKVLDFAHDRPEPKP